MNAIQALYTHLNASSGITSLSSNRIYPGFAPQNITMPYITYNHISTVPVHAMVNDAPLHEYRFQISVWTSAYNDTINLSTQVKSALRDLSGTLGTSSFIVQRVFFDSEFNIAEQDYELNTVVYHKAQDFIVWTTG